MRTLIVQGDKKFQLVIPDEATLTYGPWSPPKKEEQSRYASTEERRGTLRVYAGKSKTDILAVFSGVVSFHDTRVEYVEEVAVERGATIWHSDKNGYERRDEHSVKREWVTPTLADGRVGPIEPDQSESGTPF